MGLQDNGHDELVRNAYISKAYKSQSLARQGIPDSTLRRGWDSMNITELVNRYTLCTTSGTIFVWSCGAPILTGGLTQHSRALYAIQWVCTAETISMSVKPSDLLADRPLPAV